jgi:hypothetical protein
VFHDWLGAQGVAARDPALPSDTGRLRTEHRSGGEASISLGGIDVTMTTRGALLLRQQGAPQNCGPQGTGGACVRINQQFTARVDVPAAELSIIPVQAGGMVAGQVRPGDTYNFSVRITPNAIDGVGVPRYVRSWRFQDDSTGALLDPGCGTSTTCSYVLPRSGRMIVRAWVNNDSATASVPIPRGAHEPRADRAARRGARRYGDLLSATHAAPRVARDGYVDVAA